MNETPTRAALWIRYLGSRTIHQAETFATPTDTVPDRVAKLVRRGDVAEVWYTPYTEPFDSRLAHKEWPK